MDGSLVIAPRATSRVTMLASRLLLLLLLFAHRGASAQQPARDALIPLAVAVEDAADVWSRADGTGYANDIARAAFRAGGIEPRFQVVPYARCKALVTHGQIAACVSMSRDSSIPESVVFADSTIYVFASDFYQNVRRPMRIVGGLPARGTVVGVVRGYEYPDTLHRLERSGIIHLVSAGSELTNLRKLIDGRIDAAMVNTDATKRAEDVFRRAGMEGRVSLALRGGTMPGYVGFSMRHARGADALARFNAGRRRIAADGTLAAIRQRWADSVAVMQRSGKRAPPAR
jgi:hypothetical protein